MYIYTHKNNFLTQFTVELHFSYISCNLQILVHSQEKRLHFVKQIFFEKYVEHEFDKSLQIRSSIWKVSVSLLKSSSFSGNILCIKKLSAV